MATETPAAPASKRIASIDQLRGYAIFGMLLVNFFGIFKSNWLKSIMPESVKAQGAEAAAQWLQKANFWWQQLHHHSEYMTYADTIAPLFMFVVGIGMRLSWKRRAEKMGPQAARKSMAKRYGLLVLIAFTIYAGWLWDALMNIGLAGLLALLVVDKKPVKRMLWAIALIVAYQIIFSYTSYGIWLLRINKWGNPADGRMPWPLFIKLIPLHEALFDCPINGGVIGHWGWAFMLICGTIAYDIMATGNRAKIVVGLLAWGIALSAAGWGVRAIGTAHYEKQLAPYLQKLMDKGMTKEQARRAWERGDIGDLKLDKNAPRRRNEWVFSKNYVTIPYPLWATGLCFFHLLLFYLVCDVWKINIPHMTVLGQNPLFIYICQGLITDVLHGLLNRETESWVYMVTGFVIFYGFLYGTALYLHKKKILIKI